MAIAMVVVEVVGMVGVELMMMGVVVGVHKAAKMLNLLCCRLVHHHVVDDHRRVQRIA